MGFHKRYLDESWIFSAFRENGAEGIYRLFMNADAWILQDKTAEYIDFILTRLTVVGATYLVLVCLLPEFLISSYAVPFYFGGTSILIIVNVAMDTMTQFQGYLFAHQSEGLLKKSKLGGRKR